MILHSRLHHGRGEAARWLMSRAGFGWGGDSRGPGDGWRGAFEGRRRRGRGDVKFLVLALLADGPKHGYEIIRSFEERHGSRPSAGSIYPTLQMLEDGGFVASASVEGKRVYTITTEGREMLANRTDDQTASNDDDSDASRRFKDAAKKLAAAVMGARHADDASLERIRAILADARKRVYEVLATDES